MRIGKDPADNPLAYLHLYGITRGIWMPWLVSRGALQDWRDRPVAVADFGDDDSRELAFQAFPRLRITNERVLR